MAVEAGDGHPPLRILQVIARMNVGGPAAQLTLLSRCLDRDRFESRALVGNVGAGEADYLRLRGVDLPSSTRIDGLGRRVHAWDDARALAVIAAEMRRYRPHIVHTRTAKAGVLGRLAARLTRVPAVVHSFHGHLLHGYFSPSATRAIVLAERALARVSDRLISEGAQVRDELLAAGVGRLRQYTVVQPGMEAPPVPDRRAARATLGLPPDGVLIAFVGRVTAIKRPDRFAAVATSVAAKHPHVGFVVCGEGDLLDDLEARVDSLRDRVHLLGWRSDVEQVYAASDLAILTSDNEGMPYTLIEAALAGRPAVTTDVGSSAEIVVDEITGLVTSTSVTALVHAVDRLLDDPTMRARMGEAASSRAVREYGASRLVADMERLYGEVAVEKGLW